VNNFATQTLRLGDVDPDTYKAFEAEGVVGTSQFVLQHFAFGVPVSPTLMMVGTYHTDMLAYFLISFVYLLAKIIHEVCFN